LLPQLLFLLFKTLSLFKQLLDYMLRSLSSTTSRTPSLFVYLLRESALARLPLRFELNVLNLLSHLSDLGLFLLEKFIGPLHYISIPAILSLLR
jgi:hypothetical protein